MLTESFTQFINDLETSFTCAFFVLCSYVALFDYQPSKSDELELVKGKLYGVVEK